ncbi:uncharacterized protein METZ01_LOCUS132482, partial [marine metagenome]
MSYRTRRGIVGGSALAIGVALVVFLCLPVGASAQTTPSATGSRSVLDQYCVTCHNQRLETAGLRLDELDVSDPGQHAEVWEKVVRKLRTGTMPPSTRPQPSAADRGALVAWLETALDQFAVATPNPGRTESLRRLNRTEYQNAIRDLLALNVDAT